MALAAGAVLPGNAGATAHLVASASLGELSLEQLGSIRVTSASPRGQLLSEAPASVFVITAEDIRRSGAGTLAEALRLAPNLQVARSGNAGYSISARGLDSALSNKLLVLIDGRSIYTPLYSGVFWDAQAVVLEDIERIEVVSGAGGTLWGVNAVNGVINIVTRSAEQRAGALGVVSLGEDLRRLSARSGGAIGGDGHYTVYGLQIERRGNRLASGAPARDETRHSQAGLRIDLPLAAGSFTLIGNLARGRFDQPPGLIGVQGTEKSGADLLARWQRPLAIGGTLLLQAYAEHTRRTSVPVYDDTQDLVDLQLQHSGLALGDHVLSWGAEVRRGRDHSANGPTLAFLPPLLAQTWTALHLQDEVALAPDLQLTAGLRVERNDYSGTDTLPTLRLAWKPAPQHLLWAAASRAARAPARLDRDFYIPGLPPYQLRGGPGFQSEIANELSIGWRGQFGERASASATAFRTEYRGLRALLLDASRTAGVIGNGIDARSHGLEAWGSLQVRPGWRLHAGGMLLRQRAALIAGFNDPRGVDSLVGGNPRHAWMLRSSHDLSERLELDIGWRAVGAMRTGPVPAYHALGVRLGWQLTPAVELSVGVRELASGGHVEYGAAATRAVIEREAYVKADLRF